MTKIKDFIKKYWILLLIVVTVVFWITDKYVLPTKNAPETTPSPSGTIVVANFKDISPGISTEGDIQNRLGTALKIQKTGSITNYDYGSTNKYRNTQIQSENGKVLFVKEIVSYLDNRKSSEIISVYGKAPYVLYGSNPNSSFNIYAYPQSGIAYVGHVDGEMTEIWYFQPTTIDEFIKLWGVDYSLTPPSPSDTEY